MLCPFIACILLTGIHAYLGLHVIERGVIFVDLALAQMAALGATLGYLFGAHLHSTGSFIISSSLALCGAALFSLTRLRKQIVPQEALIGIAYAVSSAAAIIVLSRAPEGGEELKTLLVGHLLFIDWNEILRMAVLYAIIGTIHWLCRKPLLQISLHPDQAFAEGRNVRFWDFVFYGTFAFVVTSSVEVAGVLLVFSFLVVPAVCGAFLCDGIRARLLAGWSVSLLASFLGIAASYYFDFPTGATVVCVFGVALLMCGLVRAVLGKASALHS
ncbi:MAG: metal ABC transporter permease [Deltaproteobacteria bacterium]|nr:metal ABC transporter permease [Deltaproteobacteria bacterium]